MPRLNPEAHRRMLVATNSLERVVNTTVRILEWLESRRGVPEHISELVTVNLQDWRDLGPTARVLWDEQRDRDFRDQAGSG